MAVQLLNGKCPNFVSRFSLSSDFQRSLLPPFSFLGMPKKQTASYVHSWMMTLHTAASKL